MKMENRFYFARKTFLALYLIIGSLCIFLTSAQAQPPATAEINSGSIIITPPFIDGFEAMNVRIMAPDGILIVSERSTGEAIEWLPGAEDPDGRYNYEAIVISFTPDSATSNEEDADGEDISRLHGSFKIIAGEIVIPPVESTDQQQTFLNTMGNAARYIASFVMDSLLPSAHAADLTSEDATPDIMFDDTQDEDFTPAWDWRIRAEGGTSDSDTNNYFTIEGWTESGLGQPVEIFRIDHDGDNGPSSPVNALHILDNGDISFADGSLFFDKSIESLGIGTNSPVHELQLNGLSPEIRLLDESDDSYAQVEYNFGDLSLEGNSEQDILAMDATAPEDSMRIDSIGNIGIGLASPEEAVDVYRAGSAARFQLSSVTDTANQAPQFVQRRARSGPAAVQAWDNLGLISFRGHDGTAYSGSRAFITALASQNWGSGLNGTQLLFGTTPNNSSTPSTVMRITQDGRVLINGTQLNVPDYVFEDSYNLMPLDDLEKYIKEKQHLPNVANAMEVNTDGLDLGRTQMSLLEKVEELTLYTLQQHGQLKEQRALLSDQQAKLINKDASIKALEERIAMLEAAINIAVE